MAKVRSEISNFYFEDKNSPLFCFKGADEKEGKGNNTRYECKQSKSWEPLTNKLELIYWSNLEIKFLNNVCGSGWHYDFQLWLST